MPEIIRIEILESTGTTSPGGGGFPGAQSRASLQVPPQHLVPGGHVWGHCPNPLRFIKNINRRDTNIFLTETFILC